MGHRAFENCSALETITIPNSVTSILESAFDGCKNLTIMGYKNSVAENYAKENEINFIELIKKIITGDADENEIVDINDVTYLQRHIAGNKNTDELPLIDESNKDVFESVDLNKDGKLDVQDVTLLQQLIAGNKE
ncbi:leucine-rich repeat protein [uncultured Ruminococcus sp.]|uniref:leucine-rich repeat protein n=1 Tax=uncultured Ruminococcus sp. TaxID=165186 RepID=UPI002665BB99|nr:leucine-rich repeat protein [uncultured Ruminococcus sp.]